MPPWLIVLVGLALIAAGWVLLNQKRRPSESTAWRRVQRALRNDDPKQRRQAVLDWAALRWPSQKSWRVEQLAALLTMPEQQCAILQLNAAAYSNSNPAGAGENRESLALALQTLRNRGLTNRPDQLSLVPLYRSVRERPGT